MSDNENDWLDEDFELGDEMGETSATIMCPYCGADAELSVDPGGDPVQEYVEDCPICCQPWHLTVSWDVDGAVSVDARTEEEV